MTKNCVIHIKEKINDTTSCSGEIDDAVEQIMLTTFNFLNENEVGCYYCRNHNMRSVFSVCKINHHIQPNCTDHSLDIKRFMKNNYQKIISKVNKTLSNSDIDEKFRFRNDFKKQVIYESVKLFGLVDFENSPKLN